MKKYLETTKSDGNKKTCLKVEVFYSKGGLNYFNYKEEKRGYWLSVRMVETDCRQ